MTEVPALAVGDQVGRFIVVRPVGAGGMGEVYEARDPELDRSIALKVLRPSAAGELRLLREAQALAQLAHPNVVSVHDVGVAGERLFIAMELIDGKQLGEHLRGIEGWRDKLALFVQAGRGLAAAHARGIVHRDFKPQNVLVGRDGRVRVTDFGLARAAQDDSGETVRAVPISTASSLATTVEDSGDAADEGAVATPARVHLASPITAEGTVVGTPRYMAPEQLERGIATAASDQFAFCVALWEALYGEHPRGRDKTKRRAPRWLARALERGLADDPVARHGSMDALLAILERTPVRHARRLYAAAGLGALALTGAAFVLLEPSAPAPCRGAAEHVAGMWDPATKAKVQRVFMATGRANAADAFARVDRALDDRLRAWTVAHTDACEATQVRGEQSAALEDLRMRCLDRARRQIGAAIETWSERVDIDQAIAAAPSLGAIESCADTDALAAPVAPPDDPKAKLAIDALADSIDRASARVLAGDPKAALAMARAAADRARELGYAPMIAEAQLVAGRLECESASLDPAAARLREAIVAAGEAKDDRRLALAQTALIRCLGGVGERFAEATSLFTVAEAAVARAGKKDDLTASLLDAEGVVLTRQAKLPEAAEHLERAVAIAERAYGAKSYEVAKGLLNLGRAYDGLGRYADAMKMYERARDIAVALFGPDHPFLARVANMIGTAASELGDDDRALAETERALAIGEKVLRPDDPTLAVYLHNLGYDRMAQGKTDEAERLLLRAVAIREQALGPDHPLLAQTLDALAGLELGREHFAKALDYNTRALAIKQKAYGDDHPSVAFSYTRRGDILAETGDQVAARDAYTHALGIRERVLGKDHPDVAASLRGIGGTYVNQRRFADAIAPLERALAILEEKRGKDHPLVAHVSMFLGRAYVGVGRRADGARALERVLAIAAAKDVNTDITALAQIALAPLVWDGGDHARAIELATAARTTLAPWPGPERDAVDAWLRAHAR
ncbi:MAG TPA: serine/threonine-protein kinase [Kofleriaceae bacterium]|nr:serine/threonine-protein kinase [Kofleriaceae bacterium]